MSEPKTYGKSLHDLAKEEGVAEKILKELKQIADLFNKNPDYVKILDSPQIDKNELMDLLNEDFFGRVNRYTLNFLKILCEKRMVHYMDECLKEYERLYNKDNNITTVNVVTAQPMSRELTQKLVERLEEKTGGTIVLKETVDNSCIGGIIIEADGIMIDSSIKSELTKMKRALINN